MKVGYLGPPGSYSHQAILQLFPRNTDPPVQYVALPRIPALVTAVEHDDVDASVVPFENSTNGRVPATSKAVDEYGADSGAIKAEDRLYISAETGVRVNHSLARRHRRQTHPEDDTVNTTGFRDIKCLRSHNQAWGQCSTFLTKHFSDESVVKRIDDDSTSQAAELVASDLSYTHAAICSPLAAEVYELQVLAENIQDDPDNVTRFLLMTKQRTHLNPKPVMVSADLDGLPFPLDGGRYFERLRKQMASVGGTE